MEPGTEELSSRDKVLRAAMQMYGENPAARLSVRAVAARAGVSTGSLRYHFPTQRALQDEVLTRVYDLVVTDDEIHDTTIPARDRLVGRLRQLLTPIGVGTSARENLIKVVEQFVAPDPTEDTRATYLAMGREVARRVEYWLTVLAREGALPAGDQAHRARFLLTVINGLGMERAMPAEESLLQTEAETLQLAVDSVLATPPS